VVTPRGRERAVLCKPMEFMNLSGFAVQRVATFHDVPVDQIVVAHDEIDLDHGVVRVKTGGGHGGHNGLRSMIDQLGGNGFTRIRIGVGKPGPSAGRADGGGAAARAAGNHGAAAGAAGKDVAGWVLADFPGALAAVVDAMISRSADALEAILGLGAAPTMNQFNALPPLR
jgi:PTH1 family peptidyl-tRNA hydrolase